QLQAAGGCAFALEAACQAGADRQGRRQQKRASGLLPAQPDRCGYASADLTALRAANTTARAGRFPAPALSLRRAPAYTAAQVAFSPDPKGVLEMRVVACAPLFLFVLWPLTSGAGEKKATLPLALEKLAEFKKADGKARPKIATELDAIASS